MVVHSLIPVWSSGGIFERCIKLRVVCGYSAVTLILFEAWMTGKGERLSLPLGVGLSTIAWTIVSLLIWVFQDPSLLGFMGRRNAGLTELSAMRLGCLLFRIHQFFIILASDLITDLSSFIARWELRLPSTVVPSGSKFLGSHTTIFREPLEVIGVRVSRLMVSFLICKVDFVSGIEGCSEIFLSGKGGLLLDLQHLRCRMKPLLHRVLLLWKLMFEGVLKRLSGKRSCFGSLKLETNGTRMVIGIPGSFISRP
ncbi:hypothetical protein LINPERHAP2_LOCUS34361 [Linum perenne]